MRKRHHLPAQDPPAKRWRDTGIGAVLFLLTFVCFARVATCDFTNLDDGPYVTNNPPVQAGLTAQGFAWAWTTDHAGYYMPLTWLSLMLDAQMSWPSPVGFHLTNAVLHSANALLLFVFLRQATGAAWRSALAAALFALHPLRVESVAWVTERKDVLSGFFGLLALFCYVQFTPRRRAGWYILMLVTLALSLLSKPILVTFPFLLLLLDFWPLDRLRRPQSKPGSIGPDCLWRAVKEKLPIFALAAAGAVVAYIVQRGGGAMDETSEFGLRVRLANAAVSYVRYLWRMVWFGRLAIFYPYQAHWTAARVVGSVALLLGITAIAIGRRRRWPWVFVGWFWFAGGMIPVIGITQVGFQAMADRFTYFPSIGLGIAAAFSLPQTRPIPARAGAAAALAALGLFTFLQIGYWRNDISLFSHAIEVTGDNFLARRNLAMALDRQGRWSEAIGNYREALRLEPRLVVVYNNIGVDFDRLGHLGEAAGWYRRAIEALPDSAEAHSNLGAVLFRQQKLEASEAEYREALDLDPTLPAAHIGLALVREKKDHPDAARTRQDAPPGGSPPGLR